MSLSNLFESIGAPLGIDPWSWGSVRDDGTVVLRVWLDKKIIRDGKVYVQLSNLEKFAVRMGNIGCIERIDHIERIKRGADCLMLMCLAKDNDLLPREVDSYNSEYVFIGGDLRVINSDWFIEIVGKVPVRTVIRDWLVAKGHSRLVECAAG